MANFVRLTYADDSQQTKVLVNLDQVASIQQNERSATIRLNGAPVISVTESADEILRKAGLQPK